mmetsp:Transcript_8246/g.13067  ORF Transcript_8246/g.13067 Transcript_8246/m.13067 type:complete len:293 (-) Transcript_8246:84-962(-)
MKDKIEDYLSTGKISRLEALTGKEGAIEVLRELRKIWGVGAKLAARLHKAGVKSVKDLVGKEVVGTGADVIAIPRHLQVGAQYHEECNNKMPRAEVERITKIVREQARKVGGKSVEVVACGSYRRGKSESGDVDILLTAWDSQNVFHLLKDLVAALSNKYEMEQLTYTQGKSEHGVSQFMGLIKHDSGPDGMFRRMDIKAYPSDQYAFALLHMTGSDHFNRSMRAFAGRKDLTLSDHGLRRAFRIGRNKVKLGDNVCPARREEDIFAALHLEYVEPTERHSGYTIAHLKEAS